MATTYIPRGRSHKVAGQYESKLAHEDPDRIVHIAGPPVSNTGSSEVLKFAQTTGSARWPAPSFMEAHDETP